MIQIEWTAGSLEEAKWITKALLEQRQIACANLIENVMSLYVWEDKLEESQEVKVLMKTTKAQVPSIISYIEEHASYDVPAILSYEVGANHSYQDWVHNEVTT